MKTNKKYMLLTALFCLMFTACSDTTKQNTQDRVDLLTPVDTSKNIKQKKESVPVIDSAKLVKIEKAHKQSWSDKDLTNNKKAYLYSTDIATFLNEVIAINDSIMLVKDFETGQERIVILQDFDIISKGNLLVTTQQEACNTYKYIQPGTIIGVRVNATLVSEKTSVQNYYNRTKVLFGSEYKPTEPVVYLVADTSCLETYRQTEQLRQTVTFNQMRQTFTRTQ